MSEPEPSSIGIPSGHRATTCGYCSLPAERTAAQSSYHSAGLEALQLSCHVYQQMIDRGWRRSGAWCYKPDLRCSCCPQYTIRLDALAFRPSKSQRKVVNRWNRFLLQGKDAETMDVDAEPKKSNPKSRNQTFSLMHAIHTMETGFHTEDHPTHRFEVSLEPSSYTSEKYALYKKYQEEIHEDTRNTPPRFEGFLVDSPLLTQAIPYSSSPPSHLPKHYGSYHQLYRLDGELIAMAVLDILPHCVSSVYFMYDKKWEHFSFGKLSALREVTLAREINEAGASEMGYLYMGFYIYSCQKMRYKGEYSPSYLADPVTYQWYPLKDCIPLMEKYRYACFSDPSQSIEGDTAPDDDSYPSVSEEAMEKIRVQLRYNGLSPTVPLSMTNIMKYKELRMEVEDCVQGLGLQISQEMSLESGACHGHIYFCAMLRRKIRERRQYVYAKSLEAQERQIYERKQQLKDALATGKPLPTEFKKHATALGKDLVFDEAQEEPTSHIDNEYARAGVQDPKIVITTSRDPSSKLLQFTKEIRLVFPNSHRINRGNYVVKELAEACRANDVTDLIVLHEHRGVPDAMIVSHFPHGPTVYFTLNNVQLRHDIGDYKKSTVSEQYPHLVFENFSSKLGERLRDVLKYLFPVPKEDSKRVMTFANENDFISFRHHVFVKTPPRDVQLAEVGPRFELKPYEIRLGTIEQTEADREWVLAHYSRTSKKRNLLASSLRSNGKSPQSSEPPVKKAKR
ncbi:hypothetical protein APHAL10511_001776 [Amanita phalloides]|nr:hypothetical protein APHAL10511_001776 [Amanita phalloides]